jgi:hypothetical protein
VGSLLGGKLADLVSKLRQAGGCGVPLGRDWESNIGRAMGPGATDSWVRRRR